MLFSGKFDEKFDEYKVLEEIMGKGERDHPDSESYMLLCHPKIIIPSRNNENSTLHKDKQRRK